MINWNKVGVFYVVVLTFFAAGCASIKGGEKWERLFDKDLDSYVKRGGTAEYRLVNGAVVGTSKLNTPNTFLCTPRNYDDFILELEVKVDTAMNSGIQIRSNSLPTYQNGRVHGYQIEIDPSKRAWSGGIYDEARRGWLFKVEDKTAQQAFKNGQWNKYRIEAIGSSLKTFINGVPVANLTDDMTSTGFIALQVHSTKVARPMEVAWRNIRIQEIKKN